MRPSPLEPGLLPVFRFFVGVQYALILGNVLAHFRRGLLGSDPAAVLIFATLALAGMLGYLSWPALQKTLKGFYLPAALVVSAVYSLVMQNLVLGGGPAGDISTEEAGWQLFLFLFIPLVIVAWQYHFRAVVIFCAFMTAFDFATAHLAQANFQTVEITYSRLLFIRALAFLVTGYVIARIMGQFRQQRAALEQANRNLAHYASTLEQLAVSRERNRMARELHDTLAHTLSGIAVQLEAVQSLWPQAPADLRARLAQSLGMTRAGLTETRRALHDLRAAPLEELGLEPALHTLAAEAAERAGISLEWRSAAPLPKLPPDLEQGVYRVAQEAIENIVRHSGARHVCVVWTAQPGGLALSITDDGCGFLTQPIKNEGHFGLQGMRERAEMMGGGLNITSQPGQGTTVQLTVKV